MPDKIITCVNCGREFSFTVGEQGFLRGKFGSDFSPPKRCRECRRMKKLPIDNNDGTSKMHVWIMIGASGSGKSTYIEKKLGTVGRELNCIRPLRDGGMSRYCEGDAVLIAADDVVFDEYGDFHVGRLAHAHSLCVREYCSLIRMRAEERPNLIVVDNTNTSPWELSPYVSVAMAHEKGIELKIVAHMTPWQRCVTRSIHDTPSQVIRAQSRRMERMLDEWPTFWPKPELVLSRR